MIRVTTIFAIVGLSVCLYQRCDAAVVVSIDLDLVTPGIQSNIEVTPGSTVNANVIIDLTGGSSLSAYGFGIRFDTQELNFVSRTESPIAPLLELDTSDPSVEDTGISSPPVGRYGELRRFDAATLGLGPTSGSFNVAQIVFTAVAPSGSAGDVDILPGLFEAGFDGFRDNASNPVIPIFNFASVSVVPEPSSLGLVGLMAYAALGYRRNRRCG